MNVVDVEKLLSDISPENPTGDDLVYDPKYGEMTRLAQGQRGHEMIETGAPTEEVDWREVKRRCLELSSRTRDLRIAVYLTRALLATDGLVGLCTGLAVVRGLLDRHWEPVHPRLDPEDGNDPTIRVNTLVALCHPDTLLDGLKQVPLVAARTAGRFSLRDTLIAMGRLQAPGPNEPPAPEVSAVNAAFSEVEVGALQETDAAIAQSIEHLEGIEATLTTQVGAAQSIDFSPLAELLRMGHRALADQLAKKGVQVTSNGEPVPTPDNKIPSGSPTSRDDALRALDKVIEYFERYEPSSPLPLVLSRARKLAGKGFIEIMRDLAPDGLTQVEMVTRARDEQ